MTSISSKQRQVGRVKGMAYLVQYVWCSLLAPDTLLLCICIRKIHTKNTFFTICRCCVIDMKAVRNKEDSQSCDSPPPHPREHTAVPTLCRKMDLAADVGSLTNQMQKLQPGHQKHNSSHNTFPSTRRYVAMLHTLRHGSTWGEICMPHPKLSSTLCEYTHHTVL